MKAAVVRDASKAFEIAEIEVAEPLAREVLVDVRASGLCHSDIQGVKGGGGPRPMVFGHEIAGVVAAIGSDVTRVKVGDHVVAAALQPCGECEACARGALWACRRPGALDRKADEAPRLSDEGGAIAQLQGLGGFAEQALIHENQLVTINPEMPFEQASVIGCAVATGGGNVFNVAKVQAGQSVVIFGCGGVGLNAIQAAKLAGAKRVIGVDVQPAKLELATTFGATEVINSNQVDPVEAIMAATESEGVDHAFVMVNVPSTAEAAMAVLGQDGTTYIVGGMPPGTELPLRISPYESPMLSHQQGVRGTWLGSSNFYQDIPMYVDLYLQGRLNLDDLVSRTIALEEINEAYEELEGGAIARSVITFPARS